MKDSPKTPVLGEAEFSALRGEILQRAQFQQQVVNLAILVAGTLLTVFFQFGASRWILLSYPLLALFMSLEWSFNNIRIREIGWYIRTEIEEKWAGFGWESHLKSSRHERPLPWLSGANLAYGTFVALPLAVMAVAALSRFSWTWRDTVFFVADVAMLLSVTLVVRRSDSKEPVRQGAGERTHPVEGQELA